MAKTEETKKSQRHSSMLKERLMVREIARTASSKRDANICGRSRESICGRTTKLFAEEHKK